MKSIKIIAIALAMAGAGWGVTVDNTLFGDHQVFSRTTDGHIGSAPGGTSRDIGVTYTLSGAATVTMCIARYKDSVHITNDTITRVAVGSGTFTDTIYGVPQSTISGTDTNWYKVLIKTSIAGDSVKTTNKWGIGIMFGAAGQSEITTIATGIPTAATDFSGLYYGGVWKHARDNWQGDSTAASASLLMNFINKIVDSTQILCGLTGYALSSTALTNQGSYKYWTNIPATHTDTSSTNYLYGRFLVKAITTKVEYVLWFQGESDAILSVTTAAYKTAYKTLQTTMATDLGYTPTWLTIQMHSLRGIAGYNNTAVINIQKAQKDFADSAGNYFISTYDLDYGTGHYTKAAMDSIGKRAAFVLARVVNGSTASGTRFTVDSITVFSRGVLRVHTTSPAGATITSPGCRVFTTQNSYFDTTLVTACAVDGATIKIDVNDRIFTGAKFMYGYKLDSLIYEKIPHESVAGLPLERVADAWQTVVVSADSLASDTNRYWLGTTDTSWDNTANWSTTSGGSGGASVPTIINDVLQDGNGNNKCGMKTNAAMKSFYSAPSFTAGFSDNGKAVTIANTAIHAGTTLTLKGVWTQSDGDFLIDSTVTTSALVACSLSTQGTGTFHLKIADKKILGITCGYPGKTTTLRAKITGASYGTGVIYSLHVMGGNIQIPYGQFYVMPGAGWPLKFEVGSAIINSTVGSLLVHGFGGTDSIAGFDYSNLLEFHICPTFNTGVTFNLAGNIICKTFKSEYAVASPPFSIINAATYGITASTVLFLTSNSSIAYSTWNLGRGTNYTPRFTISGSGTGNINWDSSTNNVSQKLYIAAGKNSAFDPALATIKFYYGIDTINTNGVKVPLIQTSDSCTSLLALDSITTVGLTLAKGKYRGNSKTLYLDSSLTITSTDSSIFNNRLDFGKNITVDANSVLSWGASVIRAISGIAQIITGNGKLLANIVIKKTTGSTLTIPAGDSTATQSMLDSTGGLNVAGKLNADSLRIIDSVAGSGVFWCSKQAIQQAGSKSGITGTLNLTGSGDDTCKGSWMHINYYCTGSMRMMAPVLWGTWAYKAGCGKPAWIGMSTFYNYDTTNQGAANWSNRPETSVVVRSSLSTVPIAGGTIDTLLVKGAGYRAGQYGKLLYGLIPAGIESWARHGSSDTTIIVDTVPANAAGKTLRRVYDQYGGWANADSITYTSGSRHNRSRSMGIGVWLGL